MDGRKGGGGWKAEAERAYLGGRRRSNLKRVPTSVQRRPQAPSEPSGSGGPERGAARRALLALQKAARKTKAIPAGRRVLGGSRSASAVGRGGVGWVGSARPQSGPRAAAGSEARQMPAASCTSHAPFSSSALLPAPVPALFFHAKPAWGEGPTPGAPGCPAARRGLPAPGALTLSRSAPTCRHPWPAVLRGRRDKRGRRVEWRGELGAQAEGAIWRCGSAGEEQAGGAASLPRCCGSLCRIPAIRNNVELLGRRVEPRLLLSLSFSHSPSSSLSAALPVMSARAGGVGVNPLLAPTRGPRLAPASASPRTPSGPRRRRVPSEGRGVAFRPNGSGDAPSVAFPRGRGPEGQPPSSVADKGRQ